MHRICSSVLLFMVLCSQSLVGESQLIGSSDPIVAVEGDDVILPCSLQPPINAEFLTVEWTRPDLKPDLVHFYRDGRNLQGGKNPSYRYRTMLFEDELVRGNVSLKLFGVKLEDEGRYTCLVIKDGQKKETIIHLRVVAVSKPEVSIMEANGTGRVLQCESGGWYPEPELEWRDSEGRLLPADVTHRHPDPGPHQRYTVTSRVTVQKTDTNRFTCRVQLQGLNQTRETEIHVPGYVFQLKDYLIVGIIVEVLIALVGAGLWRLWKKLTAGCKGKTVMCVFPWWNRVSVPNPTHNTYYPPQPHSQHLLSTPASLTAPTIHPSLTHSTYYSSPNVLTTFRTGAVSSASSQGSPPIQQWVNALTRPTTKHAIVQLSRLLSLRSPPNSLGSTERWESC